MEIAPEAIRRELGRELARVRFALLMRQAARLAALATVGAALGVLLGVLFTSVLPWLLFGVAWQAALAACALAGVAGAACGAWFSQRGWDWPSETDCALALEARDADGSVPTAVEISSSDRFCAPVLRCARASLGSARQLRLGAALSVPRLVAAPLLALCAGVVLLASSSLPSSTAGLPTSAHPQVAAMPRLNAVPSATDLDAYQKGLNERRQQDALKQAASDLRDESKTDAQRQKSLDRARSEAAKSGATDATEIPQQVPAGKAEREALAAQLEQAAKAAGARAEAHEKGKGASVSDNGGNVKDGGAGETEFRSAPAYEPRRFDDAGQSLSDQPQERRVIAQAAADALARIKQGR